VDGYLSTMVAHSGQSDSVSCVCFPCVAPSTSNLYFYRPVFERLMEPDPAAAPAELIARLPKGVTVDEFAEARSAVQELILAKATVACVDDFTPSQLPAAPADVVVSLPKGVTCGDFAGASAHVQQIIKAASTVSKKRERSDDVGSRVARSAVELQASVLSKSQGIDRLQDEVVTAVSSSNVKGLVVSKQPTRSVVAAVLSKFATHSLTHSLTRCAAMCVVSGCVVSGPDGSIKTKKDVDNAMMTAMAIAKELDGVRSKRRRFQDDPVLAELTQCTAAAVAETLQRSSSMETGFRKANPGSLQSLTTALLDSGIGERKARYRSESCAYNALTASQALLALIRREYALSETLLALTTALSSPITQATISGSLKMNDAALASLASLCDQMRARSDVELPVEGEPRGERE
jgi:hypothetical protein